MTGWLSLTEHSTRTFRAVVFHLHSGPLAAEVRCAQGQGTLMTGPSQAGETSCEGSTGLRDEANNTSEATVGEMARIRPHITWKPVFPSPTPASAEPILV